MSENPPKVPGDHESSESPNNLPEVLIDSERIVPTAVSYDGEPNHPVPALLPVEVTPLQPIDDTRDIETARERLQKHAEGFRAIGLESEAAKTEEMAAASSPEIHREHSKIESKQESRPSDEAKSEKLSQKPEKSKESSNDSEKSSKNKSKDANAAERIRSAAIGGAKTVAAAGGIALAGGVVVGGGALAFNAINSAIGLGPMLPAWAASTGFWTAAGGFAASLAGVAFMDALGVQFLGALFGNNMAGLKSIGNDMFGWINGGKDVFKGADPSGGAGAGGAKPKKAAAAAHGGGGHDDHGGGGGHH